MVSTQSVERQLKRLKFNMHAWGRTEIKELPNILLPDEEIYECVNGIYTGGFALLVATDLRVLLIDKKPLNYLTVEDLRFEMINELDYSHRLIGAHISISAGAKNLYFKSYNQQRLRKLITHVQHCMAESKRQLSTGQQDQKQHLEQINQQLQAYLIAQHQQQQALRKQLESLSGKNTDTSTIEMPEPPKPSPELSDFLFAQSLLKQYREQESAVQKQLAEFESQPQPASAQTPPLAQPPAATQPEAQSQAQATPPAPSIGSQMADLYKEGMQEIFGRNRPGGHAPEKETQTSGPAVATPVEPQPANVASRQPAHAAVHNHLHNPLHNPLEINPLSIAYSKLPMALRNRKFGRPSFHSHSQVLPSPLNGQQAAGAS